MDEALIGSGLERKSALADIVIPSESGSVSKVTDSTAILSPDEAQRKSSTPPGREVNTCGSARPDT
ncbi:hypothetical protein ColTof3_05227 [Colletotrichum tofieldiae]|nr:hypothetical protein ColTof3_05227 [Colletotrichum tofieldiae]